MGHIVNLILRYSRLVILGSVLISIPSAYYTAKLYGNLKPDLEELLPRQSRSILDLEEIRSRLKAVQNLAVLAYSDDKAASKRFMIDLARVLEAMPKTDVAGVEYRIDREFRFFNDRKALFLDQKD